MSRKRLFVFDRYRLDEQERQLLLGTQVVPLPPQVFDLLAVLVQNAGRLLPMQDVWQRAKDGRHQLMLVAGEPGIGKTRLSLEFARSRAAEGINVLMGYSDEENLVPYQPFVECLSWYFRHCPEVELRGQLAAIGAGGELAPFVPELRNRIPDLPSPLPMDPEGQRYRLFESVAGMLAVASRLRPVLLLFGDLHWAYTPTLLLLS